MYDFDIYTDGRTSILGVDKDGQMPLSKASVTEDENSMIAIKYQMDKFWQFMESKDGEHTLSLKI